MKGFWWFREGSVAGFARPGFNSLRWMDLPFAEGILLGWVGAHPEGELPLSSLHQHLDTYAPRVLKFFPLPEAEAKPALERLREPAGVRESMGRLTQRLGAFKDFAVSDSALEFRLCRDRLGAEVRALRERGLRRIITLTEHHHGKSELEQHFDARHIAIDDLGAPSLEQVREAAALLRESLEKKEPVGFHCLAGIGRTSTVILAAHLLLGESMPELEGRIKRQNPYFILAGKQQELLHQLEAAARAPGGR